MNAVATIGHNQPPDAFDGFRLHTEDLLEQAKQFLDGEPIATEAQAEDVSRLLSMVRKTSNDADEARKAEKKPHDEAAKEVQKKWKPLLDDLDLAATTAKNALAPFLLRQDEAQRAAAEALRQEAERAAEAAAQTIAAPDDLAGQMTARVRQENATALTKLLGRAEKARPRIKGGERAVTLRVSYRAEITDPLAFGKWLWEHRREDYLEWLQGVADRECRHGPKGIPGITVNEERNAV